MKLYIQVQDGFPINHPALEDNLIEAFGAVPDDWEPFVRVASPTLLAYQVLVSQIPSYQKIDGVWTDVWQIRDMTPEERAAFDQEQGTVRVIPVEERVEVIKRLWASRPYASNFSAWTLNEAALRYEPPIPYPKDGKFYRWSGPDNNWKEAEPFPNDGNQYYFDFDNWVNVEKPNV